MDALHCVLRDVSFLPESSFTPTLLTSSHMGSSLALATFLSLTPHLSSFHLPSPPLSISLFTQDAYIQERADAMQNIEETIVELGGIFKQLAVMVKEQEEQVVR